MKNKFKILIFKNSYSFYFKILFDYLILLMYN